MFFIMDNSFLDIQEACLVLHASNNENILAQARAYIQQFQKSNDDKSWNFDIRIQEKKRLASLELDLDYWQYVSSGCIASQNHAPLYEDREQERSIHACKSQASILLDRLNDIFFSSLQDKKRLKDARATEGWRSLYMQASKLVYKSDQLKKKYYLACQGNDENDYSNLSRWVNEVESCFLWLFTETTKTKTDWKYLKKIYQLQKQAALC